MIEPTQAAMPDVISYSLTHTMKTNNSKQKNRKTKRKRIKEENRSEEREGGKSHARVRHEQSIKSSTLIVNRDDD